MPDGSTFRIMIVDDQRAIRQLIRSGLLRFRCHNVVEFGDGQEALELLKSQSVDLILTDINMPKMDGIALIRALRALPNYKFTPLLMLTTESAPEKKQEGKAAGATGWIVKPFNPEQLLATIKKVLG